jgi:hypothetical protein
MRSPYTRQQLDEALPRIESRLRATEAIFRDARPLPAMTIEECHDLFCRLMDHAQRRPLSDAECFIHGQLISVFKQAVTAETLGRPGRYFCVSEDDVVSIVESSGDGLIINHGS